MRQIAVPDFKTPSEGYKVYQRFRGIDCATDETQIDDSRSPWMVNMISDSGGYPELRVGWRVAHSFAGGGRVNGVFAFTMDEQEQLICHVGSRIVRLILQQHEDNFPENDMYAEVTLLNGIADVRSTGFYFGGDLWILTGSEFLHYDGVIVRRVSEEAYIPTTSVSCSANGGGTAKERVNLLTPLRKNTFVTDGSTKSFKVDTGAIDAGSTVRAWSAGAEITSGISFDPSTGVVTFQSAPAAPPQAGIATLTIQFSKTTAGNADKINKCKIFATFGVNTGSRVFLSANPDEPECEWYCGNSDPTYWPDQNFIKVGTSSFAIVNYLKYQGELLVIKEDNRQENTIWHHTAEIGSDGTILFPLKEGLGGIGGIARNSVQTLRDDPLFLSPQGVYAPALTYGLNQVERNLQCRSNRINTKLCSEDNIEDAISIVWKGYYLLALNGHCWIADANQTRDKDGYEWYYWDNIPATCFASISDELFFGAEDGRLCKFNYDMSEDGEIRLKAYNDNGSPIEWEWKTKLDSLGAPTRYKTLMKRGNGLLLKAFIKSDVELYIRTEKDFGELVDTIRADRFSFTDIDFSRFTFNCLDTNAIQFKKKIKKFQFIQVILKGKALNVSAGVYMLAIHFAINEYAKKRL